MVKVRPENSKFRSQVGGISNTFTTLQFGQIVPICGHAVKPLDTWRVKPNLDLKLAALNVPTRAKMYLNTAAFYVPYSILDKCFSPMIAEKDIYDGLDCKRALYFRRVDIDNLHVSRISNAYCNYVNVSPQTESEYHQMGAPGFDTRFHNNKSGTSAGWGTTRWFNSRPTTLEMVMVDSTTKYTKLMVDGVDFAHDLVVGDCNHFVIVHSNDAMYDVDHQIEVKREQNGFGEDYIASGNIFPCYWSFADIQRKGVKYDVIIHIDNGGESFYCPMLYSPKFRRWIKVFNGLGFQNSVVEGNVAHKTVFDDDASYPFSYLGCTSALYPDGYDSDYKVLAYPLLAYVKAYVDYFCNPNKQMKLLTMLDNIRDHVISQRVNSSDTIVVDQKHNPYVVSWDGVKLVPKDGHLLSWEYVFRFIVDDINLNIRPDDVTRCTSNYFRVDEQTHSDSRILKRGLSEDSINSYMFNEVDRNRNVVVDPALPSEEIPFFTKLVQSVTKHLMLNRIVGSRIIDKFRAQFGVAPAVEEAFRSKCLGLNRSAVNISQVNVTADGFNNGVLESSAGDYVGQGMAKHTSVYTLQTGKEFGYAFCVAWLTCIPVYKSRMDRELTKYLPKDFYDETYDGLGYSQPKMICEVNNNPSWNYCEDTFGYEPVYEEYANVCRDIVSGDFRSKAGYESWYTPRNLDSVGKYSMSAQSNALLTYIDDTDEFNKIFQVQSSYYDPFLLFCDIEISANRAKAPTEASLGIDAGNLNVNENGDFVY